MEEAQDEYKSFLDDEAITNAAIHEAVPLAQLPLEPMPAVAMALPEGQPEVRHSRVKDFIIIFLIVVIVWILFF